MDIKELNINQNKGTSQNHPWEYARAKVVQNLLRKFLNKEDTLYALDIGCGDIFFLNQFCKTYTKTAPIAVDTAFTEDITNALSLQYECLNVKFFNNIDNVNLDSHQASVVFLMDVIEHIEDDIQFLKDVKQQDYINDNTFFVITVPAFNNLYCSHDKWLGHHRRYNQQMLKEHTQKAGLKIVSGGYFFTTLLIPRLIQKELESSKKTEQEVTGIGGWNGSKFISKIYEGLLLCDYYFFRIFRIVGIKMPGLSTYAICKRQ